MQGNIEFPSSQLISDLPVSSVFNLIISKTYHTLTIYKRLL